MEPVNLASISITFALCPFFLPPLAEQRRIIAKVDELMTLCDKLEARLAISQTETNCLLESVLYHALKGSEEIVPTGLTAHETPKYLSPM